MSDSGKDAPMRVAAHRGSRLHAPENTISALIAGYTGGADVLELDLQLTKDGHLVVSHDPTTDRLTGTPGTIGDMTLGDLRKLDFSETFRPRDSPDFHYYTDPKRKLPIEVFPNVLEALPEDVELLIELKHDSSLTPEKRDVFLSKALQAIRDHGIASRTVVYSKDAENLRRVRQEMPALRIAAFDFELKPEKQLELMLSLNADGLVTDLDSVLVNGELTPFGKALRSAFEMRTLKVGAILYPFRKPGVFTEAEWRVLRDQPFVWSLSTDSMLDVSFSRPSILLADEPFKGKEVDRERFALGYAKANKFANVYQDDGVHVEIDPYPGFPPPPADPLEKRLAAIENKLTYTAKDWPYYSGGGLGHVPGIRGDFVAEVDYTVANVAQATTLEMAALNVDPGAHQATRPTSFRAKDSFFDPHGAPPYVGVEHDEDDGFRVNWNLGTEYDNNQYGKPVGDGKTPHAARLRLERRGAYFSTYYRNDIDARDWVCCGVTRNHTMNPVVYLRCVGKRWRQESESDPDTFVPVIPNHFVFRNLKIVRFLNSR
jgi:glycerophosphoryl diester phosphodiesterase